MRSRFLTPLLVVAFLALSLSILFVPTAAAASGAMVRVIHASPDAPGVDIYINGDKVMTNLMFKEGTKYAALAAGTYRVQVFATGTGPGGTAVIDANLPVQDGKAYTVLAVNKVANIAAWVLNDDLTPPAAGKTHIRVIHASPDAPAVDVGVKDGPVPVKNLAFKAASAYLPVDAGNYTFQIFPAGTTQAVLTTDPLALAAGTINDFVAVGLVGDKSLSVIAFTTVASSSAPAPAPGMPNTGGGGMSATSHESLPAVALLAVLLLLAVSVSQVSRRLS